MAAEAALSFAVEKLGEAAIQKIAFLRGVEGDVELLKDELKSMKSFLKDASEKQANNDRIRNWISQIRDVAHDAEDAIETFVLKVDNPRRSKGLLERFACFPCHLHQLDKLGKEIKSMRARLQTIDDSRKSFGIQDLGEGNESRRPNIALQRRRLLPEQTDKDVMGLEKDIESLLGNAILKESPGLLISSITGMGGLGKSTLAREVYNHGAVTSRRFEFRAWVVVSEEFNPKEVIIKLLGRADGMEKLSVEELKSKSVEELKSKLFERLTGSNYFIVLDDVWKQQDWEFLADAFPDEQGKISRLLLTSRKRNVPRTARYAHELKHLDPETSWQLLLKKSFIDDTNGKCPPQLEDIGREIAGRCGGLPLAITVVGGLLLEQRQSRSGWEKVLKGINSHLGRIDNGRSDNKISAVLELSYHELSPHLKSCFLCLAFFKEDAIIGAKDLVRVWIAEGLISQEEGDLDRETMEEIGRGYLEELINRNMVQVKYLNRHDQVKSCQVHDLVRDLSIKKAKEEIGFEILKEGINSQASNKCRHRVTYHSTPLGPNNKHVRSLFIIHEGSEYTLSLSSKSFPLLRVLHFQGYLSKLPKTIGELTGLKYLTLRARGLEELPRSLGRLKNLQVLNVSGIKVPNVIWKMYNLRHLYLGECSSDTPLKLDTLKNLQTLMYYPINEWWPTHLKEMLDLHKLEVNIDKNVTDVREFITSFSKMKNLTSLKLWLDSKDPLEGLDTLHSLTKLNLYWSMAVLPSVDNFPPNLSHLTLFQTQLNEDPMPVLEKLRNLLYLNLIGSYDGTEMAISDDGFPRLSVLLIERFKKLRKIELVGEGHGMPQLKRFKIFWCHELESLPKKLMTLPQELEIIHCPKLKTQIHEDGDEELLSVE